MGILDKRVEVIECFAQNSVHTEPSKFTFKLMIGGETGEGKGESEEEEERGEEGIRREGGRGGRKV